MALPDTSALNSSLTPRRHYANIASGGREDEAERAIGTRHYEAARIVMEGSTAPRN
jgi:hypothetical protein